MIKTLFQTLITFLILTNISLFALVHFRGLCTFNFNTVLKGSPEEAAAVLEHYPWTVHMRDKDGWTVVHHLAHLGPDANLILAVRHGADIDAEDMHQTTPLTIATITYRYDTAFLLIEWGAEWSKMPEYLQEMQPGSYLLSNLNRAVSRCNTSSNNKDSDWYLRNCRDKNHPIPLTHRIALVLAGDARPGYYKYPMPQHLMPYTFNSGPTVDP